MSFELQKEADRVPNLSSRSERLCMELKSIDGALLHIHPCPLIPNFLQRKNASKLHLRSLLKEPLSKQKEILWIDEDRNDSILSYYGYYGTIIAIESRLYAKGSSYIKALAAMEYYQDVLDHEYLEDCVMELSMSIIDNHCFDKCINNTMLCQIFISIFFMVNLTNTKKSEINKECGCYMHKYGNCTMLMANDCVYRCNLGYLMLFCSDQIINSDFWKSKDCIRRNLSHAQRKILHEIKKWDTFHMVEIGKKYIVDSFNKYVGLVNDKETGICYEGACNLFHIIGKASLFIDQSDLNAKGYLVISICISTDLYHRVLSLIALSDSCYETKEYLLGFKLLKCAYKLSKDSFLPSFVSRKYFKKRRKFKKMYHTIQCDVCEHSKNKSVEKLLEIKCCVRCMKKMYCSRKCQKLGWITHRNNCDGSWGSLYYSLKKCVAL